MRSLSSLLLRSLLTGVACSASKADVEDVAVPDALAPDASDVVADLPEELSPEVTVDLSIDLPPSTTPGGLPLEWTCPHRWGIRDCLAFG